jgi:hypothetical protein
VNQQRSLKEWVTITLAALAIALIGAGVYFEQRHKLTGDEPSVVYAPTEEITYENQDRAATPYSIPTPAE